MPCTMNFPVDRPLEPLVHFPSPLSPGLWHQNQALSSLLAHAILKLTLNKWLTALTSAEFSNTKNEDILELRPYRKLSNSQST